MATSIHTRWVACILTVALQVALGCGSDSDSGSSGQAPVIEAPASMSGRTFDGTVATGSGVLASTGTFRISFAASTYAVLGDGVDVANSNGTYTYSAVGAVGTAAFVDSGLGSGNFAFTYTSANTGTYSANNTAGGIQAGTFVEP